jgi:hypothetical protein
MRVDDLQEVPFSGPSLIKVRGLSLWESTMALTNEGRRTTAGPTQILVGVEERLAGILKSINGLGWEILAAAWANPF